MKFGVREICNVVFKTVAPNQKIGNKVIATARTPVIYFDTLKTSSLEQAVTTVYAQGGRGNTRLVGWDGEKTLTFTMEDALISETGLTILAGAGLWNADAANGDTMIVHVSEIGTAKPTNVYSGDTDVANYYFELDADGNIKGDAKELDNKFTAVANTQYLFDYYKAVTGKQGEMAGYQIDIEPEAFGGNFYIEADTLFRDQQGKDHPAQFIIPNGKIQSNFTLSMASSGDPSTFTFTVDAFPGYVNGDKSKKVMAAIQVITDEGTTTVITDDMAGDDDTVANG